MTIRTVGPNSTYRTIAAAVDASAAGDIISLEDRYSNERAVLTVQDLTVMGGPTSRNIELVLGVGINDVTLDGLANIRVLDNTGSNTITGNDGNNGLWVSGGADVVHGGDGRDRLVVDYRGAVTSVVATAGSVTDGGTNSVTFDGIEDLAMEARDTIDLSRIDADTTLAGDQAFNFVATFSRTALDTDGDANADIVIIARATSATSPTSCSDPRRTRREKARQAPSFFVSAPRSIRRWR
jgi:Ca2+-binding RTX toxin-like protein